MTRDEFKQTLSGLGPANDRGCWKWLTWTPRVRYQRLMVDGVWTTAHRAALELKLGRPLKQDFYALHTCDVKWCCNPAHIVEGTISDNNRDTHARNLEYTARHKEHLERIHQLPRSELQIEWTEQFANIGRKSCAAINVKRAEKRRLEAAASEPSNRKRGRSNVYRYSR